MTAGHRRRAALAAAEALAPPRVAGHLTRLVGLTLEARGLRASIGDRCLIETVEGDGHEAEVVGFANDRVLLMPAGSPEGLAVDARVRPMGRCGRVPVG
ncbi:MAG: flagellum-specific ATP synthase FliI, partial [Gammaproteobacteria bacterium]|nr:flagellum-specific ATP synthase FliI [Gammaproteobacteria bacterium]